MKVLIQNLAGRLQRFSPLAITAMAVTAVLAIGVADYFSPRFMSFFLTNALLVIFVGWGAGARQAVFVSAVAAVTELMTQHLLRGGPTRPLWAVAWNFSTRFILCCLAGWLTAELTRLNRHLRRLVDERTAQLEAETRLHKDTSSRLAEILQRFEQVINNITEVFWLTDVSTNEFVYVSPAYERIWGRSTEELRRDPQSWLAAIHPDDRAGIVHRRYAHPKDGEYDLEYRIIRPDGDVRWVRDRGFPVRNPQGEIWRIAGIAEDVTDAKEATERLQTKAAILENMAEAVVVTDEKGLVEQINPAAERMWGIDQRELIGRPATSRSGLSEQESADLMRDALSALQAHGRWRGTFRDRRRDGTAIWCEATVSRVEIHGRTLMVAVEQDVTERMRTEEALRQSEETFRVFLNAMPEPATLLDRTGKVLLVNPALARSIRVEEKELLGRCLFDFLSAETAAVRKAKLEEVALSGKPLKFEDERAGRTFVNWVNPVLDATGAVSRVAAVAFDITDRKRAELTREAFLTLGAKLSSARNPVEAAQAIYSAADSLWHWDAGALDLYLPQSEEVETILAWDVIDGQRRQVEPAHRVGLPSPRASRVMREGAQLVLRRRGDEPPTDSVAFGDVARHSASLMHVPVRVEDRAVGVLSIQSYRRDAYTGEDLRTLQALADYCGGALERLRVEQAARQRERMTQEILATAMDGYYALDFKAHPEGAIVEANEAFCRMTGYTRQELLQMRISDLEIRESPAEISGHYERLTDTGAGRLETSHRRKDGQVIQVEISLSLMAGKAGCVFGFARDITERRRAELIREVFLSLGARLGASRSPLEAARAVYAAADQLWKWDAATLDLYTAESDTARIVLNCDVIDGVRREFPPAHPTVVPSPRMRRVMQRGAELILSTSTNPPATDAIRFGDVNRPSASKMCVPIRRKDAPVGVLTIQSYTPNAFTPGDLQTLQALADHCSGALERIRTEEELRESQDLLRAFYDSPGGLRGVVELLEDDFLVLSANAAQASEYGRSGEELSGMSAGELGVPRLVLDIWLSHFRECHETGQAVTFEYSSDFRLPGSWCLATVSPLPMAGRERPQFAYVAIDITERKRAELMKETLLSLGAKLSAASSPKEAARAIFASADQLWKWDAATLDLYSPDRDWLESVLLYDVIAGERREIPPPPTGGGLPARSGRIMRQGPELILRQPGEMEDTEFVRFGDTNRLSASLMYVGLSREGQPVGVLSIQSYKPNAYTREDLRTLQALADHCAGAMMRIRAEAAVRQAHDRLEQRVQERTAQLQAANAALAANEARLELALDASNAGTWALRLADNQSDWDQRNHLLYGFGSDEPKSFAAWIGRVHPGDRRRLLAQMQRLQDPSAGDVWNEEFRVFHPTKGERWMAGLGRMERDQSGRPVRLTGINLDVTERKRLDQALREAHDQLEQRVRERTAELRAANAALRQSEERYRTLAESSPDAIFIFDPQVRVEYANSTAAALWRRRPEEIVGLAQTDLLPAASAQSCSASIRSVFETGKPVRRDEPMRFPVGDQWVEIRLASLRNAKGKVSAVMGIFRDITERKGAESQLAETLDLNQKMIAASALGIAVYQASGECVFANEALAQIVGGTTSRLLTSNFRRLATWKRSGLLQLAEESLRRGVSGSGEFQAKTRFGKNVWLDCHVAPFISKGKPHLLFMALDILKRKQAEAALSRAEQLQKALLDNIPDPVWLKDSKGRFLICNQALSKIYGVPQQGIVGKTIFECDRREAPRLNKEDRRVMSSRKTLTTEVFITDAEGRHRWYENIKSPLFDEQGTVIGTVGASREITERRRALSLLQAQRDLAVALSVTSDLDAGLTRLLDIAVRMAGLDSGGMYLPDDATGGMRIAVYRGASASFVKAVGFWPPGGPEMRLIASGRPYFGRYDDIPLPKDAVRQLEGLRATAVVPLLHDGKLIGVLGLSSHQTDQIPPPTQLAIEVIAAQAAGAIARIRVEAERHRLERQLLEISDREHARIGQDIHDGLCQQLVSLAFDANSLQRELAGARRPEARTARRIADHLDKAITESRQLSRGLFPVRLEGEGLPPALEELARNVSQRFEIRCHFDRTGAPLVKDTAVATHLYRIAQEAVSNAIRHSRASRLLIKLRGRGDRIELSVGDNGVGLPPVEQRKKDAMGLHIMDYRARTIGGTLHLRRRRRTGTLISCCVPCAPE